MTRWIVATLLVGAAVAVVAAPRWARAVVGWQPLHPPSVEALDDPPRLDEREAPRFLAARDRVAYTIEADTTVGAFLQRFHIPYDHIRRQIGEQIGVPEPSDAQPLAAGQALELTLTPPRAP